MAQKRILVIGAILITTAIGVPITALVASAGTFAVPRTPLVEPATPAAEPVAPPGATEEAVTVDATTSKLHPITERVVPPHTGVIAPPSRPAGSR